MRMEPIPIINMIKCNLMESAAGGRKGFRRVRYKSHDMAAKYRQDTIQAQTKAAPKYLHGTVLELSGTAFLPVFTVSNMMKNKMAKIMSAMVLLSI